MTAQTLDLAPATIGGTELAGLVQRIAGQVKEDGLDLSSLPPEHLLALGVLNGWQTGLANLDWCWHAAVEAVDKVGCQRPERVLRLQAEAEFAYINDHPLPRQEATVVGRIENPTRAMSASEAARAQERMAAGGSAGDDDLEWVD